ncbi:hypothetical protein JL721_7398 [Aureococcus anophagefferens]|nr:hypothetical protein JL721_7398 [Aureococcus anophagefferens]
MGAMLARAAAAAREMVSMFTSRAVTSLPPAAPPPEKEPPGGPDVLTSAAGSAAVITGILAFAGYEAILPLETLSWSIRRSVRDAPVSLRVATDAPTPIRRVVVISNRHSLFEARRAGSHVPGDPLVTTVWSSSDASQKIMGDMTYFDGYALVPTPRKPAALVRAEAGVDVARSVAARAAFERQHAALVNCNVVRFDMSSPAGDAVAAVGRRTLNSAIVGWTGHPGRDKPADPARAAALVEALGPLARRRVLRDAAHREWISETSRNYVGVRTFEAALARSAAGASSVDLATLRRLVARFAWRTFLEKRDPSDPSYDGYDVGGQPKEYVDEAQFKVLCREVAAPRADEIWAEATAGLLLPLAPIWVAPDGSWRKNGDVRDGDVTALDIVFSADMDARSYVLLANYGAYGNNLCVGLAILDALAMPREGERGAAAGEARVVETAIASLLTAERLPPLREGDTVQTLRNVNVQTSPSQGEWGDATFVKMMEHGIALVRVGGVEEQIAASNVQRVYADGESPPPAARLLSVAVADGRTDVVVRLLQGIDFALMYPVRLELDVHATALDRAIDKGNSVAAALLTSQYGDAFYGRSCNAVRNEKHLKKTLHSRLQGELLRALGIYDNYWAAALELSDDTGEMAQLAVAGDLAGVRRIFAASTARVRRAERVHNAWRATPLVPKLRDFVERKRVDALKALKSASSELVRDRAKLKEFVDARVALREPRREA